MLAPSAVCPVCRSSSYIELDEDDWDDGFPVLRCEDCGTEWAL